jgi:hypothetical protein
MSSISCCASFQNLPLIGHWETSRSLTSHQYVYKNSNDFFTSPWCTPKWCRNNTPHTRNITVIHWDQIPPQIHMQGKNILGIRTIQVNLAIPPEGLFPGNHNAGENQDWNGVAPNKNQYRNYQFGKVFKSSFYFSNNNDQTGFQMWPHQYTFQNKPQNTL